MIEDWGSGGEHCAKQTLGMLCHDTLAQTFRIAFPKWETMLPPVTADANPQSATEFREMLRRKTYRGTKVLTDTVTRMHWAITTWTTEPLEHLLLRVQWLDHRGDALLDVIDPELSPFADCRRQLFSMLNGDSLSSIRVYFEAEPAAFAETSFKQIMHLDAEVYLRFMHFQRGAIPIVRVGNPSHKFYDINPCCRFWDTLWVCAQG